MFQHQISVRVWSVPVPLTVAHDLAAGSFGDFEVFRPVSQVLQVKGQSVLSTQIPTLHYVQLWLEINN